MEIRNLSVGISVQTTYKLINLTAKGMIGPW